MNSRQSALFDELIPMEKKAAAFYRLLAKRFREDAPLWSSLKTDEENHAQAIRRCKKSFLHDGLFPFKDLELDLVKIRETGAKLDDAIALYEQRTPPARKYAFMSALMLESLSGEDYFQLVADLPADNPASRLLRTLIRGEIGHTKKITDRYMRSGHMSSRKPAR